MIPIKARLYHPLIVVSLSIIISLATYSIAYYFVYWQDLWVGFFLSILIPLVVFSPIAFIMDGYFKKLNKQKSELVQLDKTNKKLFLLISHDVRAPLTSLKGMIDLIDNDTLDFEQSKLYLHQLSDKLENVNFFLDGLFDWSKRQTQNKPLLFSSIDCVEAILPICNLLEQSAQTKDITIITKNLKNNVLSDRGSYLFVLRNIIQNAIKFTPEHGTILIETAVKNGKTYTSILDFGVGISEKEIAKILAGDNWHTTKGTSEESGSGFGLKTCIYYLKKNNGELLIESEVNKGTKITIILPQG